MRQLLDIVTAKPRTVIAVCIILTVLLGLQLPKLTIDPSIKSMLPDDFPSKILTDEIEEIFGGSEVVMIAIKADDIFTQRILRIIEEIHISLEDMEEFEDVISLFSAKDIQGTEWGMDVSDLIEYLPETDEELAALKEALEAEGKTVTGWVGLTCRIQPRAALANGKLVVLST